MRPFLAVVLFWVALAGGLAAQPSSSGTFTFVTGGQTYRFTGSGDVDRIEPLDGRRAIRMDGAHPDGTRLSLWFAEENGRADEILFIFGEPDTGDTYGREWEDGRGFTVTLTELRRQGDTLVIAGTYGGEIRGRYARDLRAQISGTFAVTLVEPVYSPN